MYEWFKASRVFTALPLPYDKYLALDKKKDLPDKSCKSLSLKFKNGRGERIRTSDPCNPIAVRYQTAPRPDYFWKTQPTNSNLPLSMLRPEVALHAVSEGAVLLQAKKYLKKHLLARYQTAPRPDYFWKTRLINSILPLGMLRPEVALHAVSEGAVLPQAKKYLKKHLITRHAPTIFEKTYSNNPHLGWDAGFYIN
jgi:hypothetical protein